jgi:4-amino-4-deoxy-L-arabinose transferase-like glycosyltransferase
LLALLLVALVARLAALVAFADLDRGRGDESYYLAQARSLVQHGVYNGALRPPAQSAAIAGVFAVFGESLLAARLLQVIFSLATVGLVFDVCRHRLGVRAASASALLCAIHPTLVHYAHLLWSETSYGMLLLLVIWSLERFDRDANRGWIVMAGVALGGAALTRETALYFLPVAGIWLLLGSDRRLKLRDRARPAILLGLATLVVVAPWAVRNSVKYDALVSLSTNRWRMIAQGNVAPEVVPTLRARSGSRFVYRDARHPLGREQIARGLALDAIRRRQPWWLAEKVRDSTRDLVATKSQLARFLRRGWLAPDATGAARALVAVETAILVVVLVAGVAGLWLARAGRLQALVVSLIAVHWAIYVVSFAHYRFAVPLLPLLAIVAGPVLTTWPPWHGRRAWQVVGAAASLVALVLLVVRS